MAIGLNLIDRVPARGRDEPTDRLPAGTSIQLYRPAHVNERVGFNHPLAVVAMAHHAAAHTQGLVGMESLEALLEIVRRETDVTVQLHNETPVRRRE